ncbi:MAG TPA: protease modulator HflC [Acidiferrobacterales bacterium]|nr:protease modulator HflC [Acidiferrobacterales bacterium]
MNQTRLFAFIAAAAFVLIMINATVYTVDEREKAIVVKFGEVMRYEDKPGLHFKLPFINSVRYYDARILTFHADPQPFLTKEKKKVVVDYFVKWRIADTLKFYVTLGGDEQSAGVLLSQLISSGLRDEFGKRTNHEVISGDRRKIMEILSVAADKETRTYGIQVVDVRIQRVDLPNEVSQSVYQRMEAERARTAKELRAQGAEAAEKIRADADRQREILMAEAYREAERLRGEGDARATAIYAQAYSRDPEFYSFYRSLNAYKESFKDKSDIMVVDPSADFFKYLKKPRR